MKRTPNILEDLLSKQHKHIWETGEIKPIKLKMYDACVSVSEKLNYDVVQHREYVDVYKFVLKENKKEDKRIKRSMFLFP